MFTELQEKIINFVKENPNCQTSDIAHKLDVDKRTITRNIKDLLSNKFIISSGAGRSVAYRVSESFSILEPIDVEEYFLTEYPERKVNENFNFDIFEKLKAPLFTKEEKAELEELHKKFIKNISTYDSQTLVNKEYERIMIEFSWKSSAIEGNTYSLLNTEALIKENIKDPGKTEEESQMILNHKDAFNESIQNKDTFSQPKISDLEYVHEVLTKKIGIKKNIRRHGVGISGTKYKPLDNEYQIREALQCLIKLISQKDSFFEKSFLALILLSYTQAFEDGNKRTARMVSNAILLSNNSVPLSYRAVDVVEYKKASILFYEINNISYFKRIFIDQYRDAVNNYFQA